jgi:hypothetical protein
MIPEIPDTSTIVSRARKTPAANARTETIRRFVYISHSTYIKLRIKEPIFTYEPLYGHSSAAGSSVSFYAQLLEK